MEYQFQLNRMIYERMGKFIDYIFEYNVDGTLRLTLKYDGYYDDNKKFHEAPVHIVIPRASINPNSDYPLEMQNDNNIIDYLQVLPNKKKVLFELIIPDNEE